jgi:DNA-directed RNA polymerase specialized sigma24 family protein
LGESKEGTGGLTESELWKLAFKRLVLWTVKKHRMNPADAEETVQDAIRLFLKAGGVADPANPKTLLDALGSKVNGIAVNRRRKKAELAVSLTADGAPAELPDPPNPEDRIVDDHIARRAVSALLARLDGDELVTSVLMQMLDGVEDAADQAKALGRDIHEVYKARRRLKGHADAVEKLMEKW